MLGLGVATRMQGRQEEKASGANLINWEWESETVPGVRAKVQVISAFSFTALKPIPWSLRGRAPNGAQVRVGGGAGRGRGMGGKQEERTVRP